MHYEKLADQVIATGWSDLASRVSTPAATLGSDIRTNHSDRIKGDGKGHYTIIDRQLAISQQDVREALEKMLYRDIQGYQSILQTIFWRSVDLSAQVNCKLRNALNEAEIKLKKLAIVFSSKPS